MIKSREEYYEYHENKEELMMGQLEPDKEEEPEDLVEMSRRILFGVSK